MLVLASGESATLDLWRTALADGIALVEVRSFEALPKCLAQLHAEVLLLDARLPRTGTAHAVSQLLAVRRNARIVVATEDDAEDVELAIFLAGARGVCRPDAEPALLRQVVAAVVQGELWIRRGLVPKLVDSLTTDQDESAAGATGRFAILTPREIEIARLVGEGTSNKGIARRLSITERTVKAHLTMIFRKMGADDRVKLALLVSRRH